MQCRKCKSTPNTPAEYIGQTKRALRERFEIVEHRRAIQNKLTTRYHSILINPDTKQQTSNLSHSNLYALKENLYVYPASRLTGEDGGFCDRGGLEI